MKEMIDRALERYSSDKSAEPDFAYGAKVVHELTSPSYLTCEAAESPNLLVRLSSAVMSATGLGSLNSAHDSNQAAPEMILSPDSSLGQCWAMNGTSGRVTLRLYTPVRVTAFSVEHLPKSVLHQTGTAPAALQLFGLRNETDPAPVLLAAGRYDLDAGKHVQRFAAPSVLSQTPFQLVQLHILSNHGSPAYTCVYRVRVHGTPQGAACVGCVVKS